MTGIRRLYISAVRGHSGGCLFVVDHEVRRCSLGAVSTGGEVLREEVAHIGGGVWWGRNPASGRHPGGGGADGVEGLDAATAVAALQHAGHCGLVVPAAVTIPGQQQAFQ